MFAGVTEGTLSKDEADVPEYRPRAWRIELAEVVPAFNALHYMNQGSGAWSILADLFRVRDGTGV